MISIVVELRRWRRALGRYRRYCAVRLEWFTDVVHRVMVSALHELNAKHEDAEEHKRGLAAENEELKYVLETRYPLRGSEKEEVMEMSCLSCLRQLALG